MSAILRLLVRSGFLNLNCPVKKTRTSKSDFHLSMAFGGGACPAVQFRTAGLSAWDQRIRRRCESSLAGRERRSFATIVVRRSSAVIVESGDFSERVLNSDVPVLVDFYADWCGPCRNLGPRLEAKVDGQDGRVLLAKVDVDSVGGGLVEEFQISSIPTVIAFKDGKIFGRFEGDVEDAQIDELLENITAE